MADYGYLHLGQITSRDEVTGGYFLESVGLARTSKWGPTSSCVPGLIKGDRVVLGATGTSRDDLVILSKVGADFPDITDIDDLLDALFSKADAVAIDQLANWSTALEGRIDVLETGAGGLDTRVDALEADSVAQDGRLDVLEAATPGGAWTIDGAYECPGLNLDNCDRLPWGTQLWGSTGLTLGPDGKHWVIDKTGLWTAALTSRWTTPIRIPSGTAGEGSDRSFVLATTAKQWGPPNAKFETGVSGWTATGGALSSSATQKHSGALSAKLIPDGVSAQCSVTTSVTTPVTAGDLVTALAWVWVTSTTVNYSTAINWFNASGVYISTSSSAVTATAGYWNPISFTATAPAGAAFAAIAPVITGTPAAAQVWYVDDVSIGPSLNATSWAIESWNEVNAGTQHNRTFHLSSDLLLSVGDRVAIFPYWNGPATDRLQFPAASTRVSLTWRGHL